MLSNQTNHRRNMFFALLILLSLWVRLWVTLYCDQWKNTQCFFKYFEQCIYSCTLFLILDMDCQILFIVQIWSRYISMLIILLFLWVWDDMWENQPFLMQYYTNRKFYNKYPHLHTYFNGFMICPINRYSTSNSGLQIKLVFTRRKSSYILVIYHFCNGFAKGPDCVCVCRYEYACPIIFCPFTTNSWHYRKQFSPFKLFTDSESFYETAFSLVD